MGSETLRLYITEDQEAFNGFRRQRGSNPQILAWDSRALTTSTGCRVICIRGLDCVHGGIP